MRYKRNGVPVLSRTDIDAEAEAIVRELMPSHFSGQVDATDLRLLLDYLGGWHYTGRYISRNGTVLGLATFNGGEMYVTD